MGDQTTDQPLHVATPLIQSQPLSEIVGFPVYLKLENTQPSASFKIRGIGNLCQKAVKNGSHHIVCSSGGNAGMAATYAARKLNVPATIFVPETTPEFTVRRMEQEGATVNIHGKVWDEANEQALKMAAQPGHTMVHPFEHPDIWDGHSTMITEIANQIAKPDVVVASVGGGGLMCGVIQGLQSVGWEDVPVVAMETKGAESFNAALSAGKVVTLPGITSIAKSLGSKSVSPQLFELSKQHKVFSEVLPDAEIVKACLRFADDHRMLVEPACGAALAAVYSGVLKKLQQDGKLNNVKSAVIIVCGGSSVTMELLDKWKTQFGV